MAYLKLNATKNTVPTPNPMLKMNLLEGLRAVTFDAGGTLIEPWPSVGHIYSAVAAEHGWGGIPPARLNAQFARAWRDLPDFEYTPAGWSAIVDATFQGLLETPPSQSFFPALYDRFNDPRSWHIYPDVLPALERLAARGLALGVISNWDERLRPLLHALDLARHFRAIVISHEAGARKPAPEIFQSAVRELGLAAEHILHIGDSTENDLAGAQAAGFRTVLLRRSRAEVAPGEATSLEFLR